MNTRDKEQAKGFNVGKLKSIAELVSTLDVGIDDVSDSELEHVPVSKLIAALAPEGVLDDYRFMPAPEGASEKIRELRAASAPPIPRHDLLWQIRACLHELPAFVLRGPAGTGKSYIVNKLLQAQTKSWRPFSRYLFVDASALRMEDPRSLEQAALRAVFGTNDDIYQRFQAKLAAEELEDEPLVAFMRRKGRGTLLVIDHAEHLDNSPEIQKWLKRKLIPAAEQSNVTLLFCVRTPASDKGNKVLRQLPYYEVGDISENEIADWLDCEFFLSRGASICLAKKLHRVTGGRPRLLRDFANYLSCQRDFSTDVITNFTRWRAEHFLIDCERFVWAARKYPDLLVGDLDLVSEAIDEPKQHSIRTKVRNALLATGAVKATRSGGLRFVSPIHKYRMYKITSLQNLPLLMYRCNLKWLNDNQGLTRLWRFGEVASEPLSHCVAAEHNATFALKRFREILDRWGMESEISLCDPNNSKLWIKSVAALESPLEPLFADSDRVLTRAIQSGTSKVDEDGTIFIPIIGNSGSVEIIIRGKMKKRHDVRFRDIYTEHFIYVIRAMRPVLNKTVAQYWMQRQNRLEKRRMYLSRESESCKSAQLLALALADDSPIGIAVLERTPHSWLVSKMEVLNAPSRSQNTAFTLSGCSEQSAVGQLDRIASHRSGRGLVLGAGDVSRLFPDLAGRKTAMYLRPVHIENDEACRLVVFLFEGAVVGRLDGQMQHLLCSIAPEFVPKAS